jgi:hypothetical protein
LHARRKKVRKNPNEVTYTILSLSFLKACGNVVFGQIKQGHQ